MHSSNYTHTYRINYIFYAHVVLGPFTDSFKPILLKAEEDERKTSQILSLYHKYPSWLYKKKLYMYIFYEIIYFSQYFVSLLDRTRTMTKNNKNHTKLNKKTNYAHEMSLHAHQMTDDEHTIEQKKLCWMVAWFRLFL